MGDGVSPRLLQIERELRRRKAKLRLFLRYALAAGPRAFWGRDRHSPATMAVAVSPDVGSAAEAGSWRVTWFLSDEPLGHTTRPSFAEAVEEAVRWHGLDLDTVRFEG